jgi:hypothetical protein
VAGEWYSRIGTNLQGIVCQLCAEANGTVTDFIEQFGEFVNPEQKKGDRRGPLPEMQGEVVSKWCERTRTIAQAGVGRRDLSRNSFCTK